MKTLMPLAFLCVGLASLALAEEPESTPPATEAGSGARRAADVPAGVAGHIAKLGSADPKTRALAAIALREMGARAAPAIPHLIRLLGDKARYDHQDVYHRKPTFFTFHGRSVGGYVGAEATGALAKIGKPALKPLTAALKARDPRVRVHAARALERIRDPGAVESLCDALRDEDPQVRSAAAIALGVIGDAKAAARLTGLFVDKEHAPRRDAIDALVKLGKPATKAVVAAVRGVISGRSASRVLRKTKDAAAVQPLIRMLADTSAGVRRGAALCLGFIGDRRAVEPLVKLLEDDDSYVRADAVEALYWLGGIPLEVWRRALQDEESQVRIHAASALGRHKPAGAVDVLIAALRDRHAGVRHAAITALTGLRDRRALPALIEMLADRGDGLRRNAAYGLGWIRDRRAVKPLIKALKDVDADVRATAAFALGRVEDRRRIMEAIASAKDEAEKARRIAELKPRAPESTAALCAALRDEAPEVRERAAIALRNLSDPRAVPALVKAVGDPDWLVAIRVAEALGQIRDQSAVPGLLSALKEELEHPRPGTGRPAAYSRPRLDSVDMYGDAAVAAAMIRALGRIGQKRGVPALLGAMKDKRWPIRREAARALGRLKARSAVAALTAELKRRDPYVTAAVVRALGEIGDPGPIELLIDALRDDQLRGEAATALQRITGQKDMVGTWPNWHKWWQKNKARLLPAATPPATQP